MSLSAPEPVEEGAAAVVLLSGRAKVRWDQEYWAPECLELGYNSCVCDADCHVLEAVFIGGTCQVKDILVLESIHFT